MNKSVAQKTSKSTKTTTTALAATAPPRRVCEHSGAFEGEAIADAVRRHVAWITLALEQLDQVGDPVQTSREIGYAAKALLRLSLEVDQLEAHATRAQRAELEVDSAAE